MNKKNVWKKWMFGAGVITIFLMASPLTAAHLETNISIWQLIVDIGPDEHERRPFREGEIEFWALVMNSEFSDYPTPPITYEIWVEQWFFGWHKIGEWPSGDIGPLYPGCCRIIDDLDWYFSDPGLFRVCIKVTAGNIVLPIDCFTFLVFPHGASPGPIPQGFSWAETI